MSEPNIEVEEGAALNDDILPLFLIDGHSGQIEEYLGTGFLLADGLLVTCWHCVNLEVAEGHAIVAVRMGTAEKDFSALSNISRDANGRDLATANVDLEQRLPLMLAPRAAAGATDVWTYGFPWTSMESTPSGNRVFHTASRYLEGYITRAFWLDPSERRTPSYEVDMPIAGGLSGAPLVGRPGRAVYGVLVGRHDVDAVEELSTIDPDTGNRTPELVRRFSFAIAHYTSSLHELSGLATDDRSLVEFLLKDQPGGTDSTSGAQ